MIHDANVGASPSFLGTENRIPSMQGFVNESCCEKSLGVFLTVSHPVPARIGVLFICRSPGIRSLVFGLSKEDSDSTPQMTYSV